MPGLIPGNASKSKERCSCVIAITKPAPATASGCRLKSFERKAFSSSSMPAPFRESLASSDINPPSRACVPIPPESSSKSPFHGTRAL